MKNRAKKSKITFDEEVVTKQDAKDIIRAENSAKPNRKRKSNSETETSVDLPHKNHEIDREDRLKQQVKKKRKQLPEPAENEPNKEPDAPKEKKESNRAKKRKKHAELQQQIKQKTEQELQQKALNYLSKWQHCKQEWKFEKLRQVWLQQNLLDPSKVPEEYWSTALQYFSGSEGRSRQTVLEMGLKLIENGEDDQSEEYRVKVNRARDLVQHLQ